MGQSQKVKMWAYERYDLPDYDNLQNFMEDDLQLQNLHLLTGGETAWVVKGFIPAWAGGSVISLDVTNSALFNALDPSNLRGTLFITEATTTVDNVTCTAANDNYIHIMIDRATTSPGLRTFWNPAANDGSGGEYQETVDTAEIKELTTVVTLGSPSADPAHILVCKVVVDGVGNVTSIEDERNLYYRLGKNTFFAGIGSVGTVTFLSAGIDDMTAAGAFTGISDTGYLIEIDATGAPDDFVWSNDGGGTWSAAIPITADTPQLIEKAVYITFESEVNDAVFAGVGLNDGTSGGTYTGSTVKTYTITIDASVPSPDTFTWDDGGAPTVGVGITGAAQTLSDGVTITFAAVDGHTIGESWTFDATPGDIGHTLADQWSFTAVANAGGSYRYVMASPGEPNADLFVDVNAFLGGDKELDNLKEWMDFMMSQILEIKFGDTTTNNYWYEEAPANLASFGIGLNGGGVITWTLGANDMTFTSDFVILLPGTAFTNYIRVADFAGSIIIPNNNMVVYANLDKSADKDLQPITDVAVITSALYEPNPDRVIICRRVNDAIYVGI